MPTGPSAGLLLYRRVAAGTEVLLFHKAGPAFAGRDAGAWTVAISPLIPPEPSASVTGPDGGFQPRVRPRKPRLTAASLQEALEEHARDEIEALTGFSVPQDCAALGGVKMRGHRIVYAWACEDRSGCEPVLARPQADSGRAYDRAAWHPLETARALIDPQQRRFLDQLEGRLAT